jgi:hypothetical protein
MALVRCARKMASCSRGGAVWDDWPRFRYRAGGGHNNRRRTNAEGQIGILGCTGRQQRVLGMVCDGIAVGGGVVLWRRQMCVGDGSGEKKISRWSVCASMWWHQAPPGTALVNAPEPYRSKAAMCT